ncbi:MAG: RNA-binding protein [Nannocystaceae bacterium]
MSGDPKKLFIGNLDFATTADQLSRLFGEEGEITDIFLPTDRATGRPRGFGFVTFADEESAARAMSRFDGQEVSGRRLRVSVAEERSRAPRRSFGGPPPASGGYQGGGMPDDDGAGERFDDDRGRQPSRPKGSRRGVRGKKRSL